MVRVLSETWRVKTELSGLLDMEIFGELSSFLGVTFIQDEGLAWLSQSHYCKFETLWNDVVQASVHPCLSWIRSARILCPNWCLSVSGDSGVSPILATLTHLDIFAAVTFHSKHNANPRDAKWLLRRERCDMATAEFALKLRIGRKSGSIFRRGLRWRPRGWKIDIYHIASNWRKQRCMEIRKEELFRSLLHRSRAHWNKGNLKRSHLDARDAPRAYWCSCLTLSSHSPLLGQPGHH